MNGQVRDGVVAVGGNAKQRLHDSRGYGRPVGGNEIELSRVEAAHLLFRGDLDSVDGSDFRGFFVRSARESDYFALRFLVYADLRDRGFYLSPAIEGWPGEDPNAAIDFTVYPRGKGPGDGVVEYRVSVVGERQQVAAADLDGFVLAVVDEESELTYLETGAPDFDGGTDYEPPSLSGALLDDRVVCFDAPPHLFQRGFYGQPLTGRAAIIDDAVQLSLVEAAALAADGALVLDDHADAAASFDAILENAHTVEGDRFDRRLAVYRTLRTSGVVPKTGFKFGADFRTYDAVDSVDDLPHSEHLVRVVPTDHVFDPRDLSLDVRLAGGVRKRMVFALTDTNGSIEWLSVSRLTP
ncbi:tRNA-intron lyase [Haloferacaceae archaeon DSL9]